MRLYTIAFTCRDIKLRLGLPVVSWSIQLVKKLKGNIVRPHSKCTAVTEIIEEVLKLVRDGSILPTKKFELALRYRLSSRHI